MIKANRDPLWQRALAWLMEDPSKAEPRVPSERDKAVAAIHAQDRAERRRYVRGVFGLKKKPAPEDIEKAEERLEAREDHVGRQAEVEGLYGPGARAVPEGKEGGPVARFFDRVLGAKRVKEETGRETYVPPADEGWRWKLHQFMRSRSRAMSFARTTTVIAVVLMVSWVTVFAVTGYDLLDTMRSSGDAEEVDADMEQYKLPFFIVESGSMMHTDAAYGRIGTVDPGDLVVIGKVGGKEDIQTFYGPGDRHVGGAKGDVIMYLPVPVRQDDPVFPVIHRAMAYIEYRVHEIPDPNATTGVRFASRYTVEEFGIYDARAVTIPELGLYNYRPDRSGFITRGDNERTNTWADQSLGVTPFPVPESRILGRMVMEVPYIGLAKLAITGQDPALLSPDEEWCSFLAGQAPCDTWQVFIVGATALVGGPILWALILFSRRAYVRRLDRLVLAKRQEEEADAYAMAKRREAERRAESGGTEGLMIHDASDLVSGQVDVGIERRRPTYSGWTALERRGGVSVWQAPVDIPPPAAPGHGEPTGDEADGPRDPPGGPGAEATEDMSRADRLKAFLAAKADAARTALGRLKRPRSG
ncbi:MAG: S26 family signal peptidase [Euryarchaeota archaeon]|nr:S26 family signal peptidase [Euryarchaeota archaeon]